MRKIPAIDKTKYYYSTKRILTLIKINFVGIIIIIVQYRITIPTIPHNKNISIIALYQTQNFILKIFDHTKSIRSICILITYNIIMFRRSLGIDKSST